jgi:hypothetical protein
MEERLLDHAFKWVNSPTPRGFWGRDNRKDVWQCHKVNKAMAAKCMHIVSADEYDIVRGVLVMTNWYPGDDDHGAFLKGFAWHNSGRVSCSAPGKDGKVAKVGIKARNWRRVGRDVSTLLPITGNWINQVQDIATDAVNVTKMGNVKFTALEIILRPCYTELDELCGVMWNCRRQPMFPVIHLRGVVEMVGDGECSTSSSLDPLERARRQR